MDGIKLFGVLLMFISAVFAEYCTYYTDYGAIMATKSMYCSAGCCGGMYDRYCCSYEYYNPVGAIVGIVVGCVCGLILLVSIIVAVCCCCKKSRGQSGQVCQPAQPSVNIMYSVPNSTVAYGTPVGYNNMGFMQTTTMTAGTAIPPAPMQPNPYVQSPTPVPMQPHPYAQASPAAPMQPNLDGQAPPDYEVPTMSAPAPPDYEVPNMSAQAQSEYEELHFPAQQ